MFFEYGREERFPTQYDENRTPVTVDVLDTGFILAAVLLGVSFYVSIISTRKHENIFTYTRITISIIIGAMIILANFGQEWEVGHIVSRTPYKAGSIEEVNAAIGIKIGLRSVNVTLKTVGEQANGLRSEKIDYNERFHWTWDQGRFGFGPYAGQIQREFREAQYRGAPLPILWIVDYFVIDGEGFRHGRFYRTAGWYSHICMWTAFPCWLLANIYFRSVVRYGGYWMGVAGALQLLSNLLWLVIRNPNPLVIPFEDATIVTKFGPSYWLAFSSGIICIAVCVAIVIAEHFFNAELHWFFGVDPLKNSDEKYLEVTEEEYNVLQGGVVADGVPLVNMRAAENHREATKTLLVHVRKNTNSILRKNRSSMNQAIYGNLETVHANSRKTLTDNLMEEEPDYGNIQSTSRAAPPPPPRRR